MGDSDRSFDVSGGDRVPVGPGHDSTFDSTRLDFGHHRVLDSAVPHAGDWER